MVGNNRVVTGYYSYIGPDGKLYTTHYTSDQNGYRASGSHLPVQDGDAQPTPINYGEPIRVPVPIPNQFESSTPGPFFSSTPFGPNPAYSPSTLSPIVSSSTPFQSYTPSPQSYAPAPQSFLPPSKRLPFPVYRQPPQSGYIYDNPRVNSAYSVVSQQTPAPVSFPSSSYTSAPSNINSRIATTLAPPIPFNDFNSVPSSTTSPFENDAPVQFKQYIPPPPIVSSTPRPFNNQPETVLITPRPSFQQPQLPNSLSVNQNLLPPYLSVGPLNSSPPQRFFPTAFGENIQPLPQTVAPLTVTNLNFRKKRDDAK